MARVLALTGDLLFGSRVQADLGSAGHDVELIATEHVLRERLALPAAAPTVLIFDLTDDALDGAGVLASLARDGVVAGARTLAYYSHVETATRERAERAGFDLVVPRSRMAREGAALVERLIVGR